jgi:hypothetical protein
VKHTVVSPESFRRGPSNKDHLNTRGQKIRITLTPCRPPVAPAGARPTELTAVTCPFVPTRHPNP